MRKEVILNCACSIGHFGWEVGGKCRKMEEVDSKDVVKVERSGGNGGGYNRSELPDLLRVYYKWLFPYDKYFEWLQYGEK